MSATLELDFVTAATGGAVARRSARRFHGVSIDGRKVPAGGLWFAIRGERFDGHDFAAQARSGGAAGLVVGRGRAGSLGVRGVTVIEVDDPTLALGALARAHRLRFPSLRVVGVTGSNGKTTTREMIAAILRAHGAERGLDAAVHKTSGNLNNHLGLPLTLLGLEEPHRYAVLEMGMSARGEIAYLAELARPDVGVIVNIGPSHLEALGSIDEIARAKGELFAALGADGVAVFPAAPDGDPRIAEQAEVGRAVRKIRFGSRPGIELRVESAELSIEQGAIGTRVGLRLPDGAHLRARLHAVGRHHAMNAAAAAAVGYALGVSGGAIARGLAAARGEKHRSTLIEAGGRRILDDCYNASPLSTAAALDTLAALRGTGEGRSHAIALLGDMLELGPEEAMLHRSIGERAAGLDLDRLITVGERARHIAEGALKAGLPRERVIHVATVEQAAREAGQAGAGDYVLVKGSRGMKLERAVDALTARFAAMQQD